MTGQIFCEVPLILTKRFYNKSTDTALLGFKHCMNKEKTLFVFLILIYQLSIAQVTNKITGPLGMYDMVAGYSYSDSTGLDSVTMQSVFRFGEPAITNQAIYNGLPFLPELDTCNQWNCNRIFGIIQPPTEHGVYNQPADTSLFYPFLQSNGPGMIQGGQRFSRLSQLYSGYCGVYLDDWNMDTSITRQVRDAVRGKYVDASGNVCNDCEATTPYNKTIAVIYSANAIPDAMPVIDGLVFSLFHTQDTNYTQIDSDITQLDTNFPNKDITVAIFIANSYLNWANPTSVQYMLAHTLDRYDEGDINGITIFAGVFLLKDRISIGLWDTLGLPQLLDSIYFPYLGQGQGKVYDCSTGNILPGAAIHVFCQGRVSGDTLMRSYQKSGEWGQYEFGLWAGNRNTDSTYYWLIAEAPGYITDTVGFWIGRNDTTTIPPIRMCPGINTTKAYIQAFPNPTNGYTTLEVIADAVTGQLNIFDMLGRKVYSTPLTSAISQLDLSGLSDGTYVVSISDTEG